MIIVKLNGGLGNQLFQYALGRHLAEKNSTFLKLDLSAFETYKLRNYGLQYFNILEHIATQEEIVAFKYESNSWFNKLLIKIGEKFSFTDYLISIFYKKKMVIKESQFLFDPIVLLKKGNIYLEGYWQSEKYFLAIRDILLKELTVKNELNYKTNKIVNKILNTESVSIHFRRGDYVNDPLTNEYHGLCSFEYYQKAINQIIQKLPACHFFVFSDDPKWVKDNFNLDYPKTIIDHNDTSNDYEDLWLMSLCHHNIVANSSFSWWGAWLNNYPAKVVYAPKKWFKESTLNTKNLIPESWFTI